MKKTVTLNVTATAEITIEKTYPITIEVDFTYEDRKLMEEEDMDEEEYAWEILGDTFEKEGKKRIEEEIDNSDIWDYNPNVQYMTERN